MYYNACLFISYFNGSPPLPFSAKNFNKQQPLLLISLVTAHEFGHNFGSLHDPESAGPCSPVDDNGGKFLMFAASVDGSLSNNNQFSSCSVEDIVSVLESPTKTCFIVEQQGFCGDSIVDSAGNDGLPGTADDEECDAGRATACCTDTCKLTPLSTCADTNSICCNNCNFDPNLECFTAFKEDRLCRKTVRCGDNQNVDADVCPAHEQKRPGASCTSLGECLVEEVKGSRCRPFCERFSAELCDCPNDGDACKFCCIHSNSTSATPFCQRNFVYITLFNSDTMLNETTCFHEDLIGTSSVNASSSRSTPHTPFQPQGNEEAACRRHQRPTLFLEKARFALVEGAINLESAMQTMDTRTWLISFQQSLRSKLSHGCASILLGSL
eukprot:m.217207 g.217207  ORF g.217207 m.217207 type:complete len:383 (+) comp13810_c0_seq30:1268-2416(+)